MTSGASLPHWGRLRRPALSLLSPPGWRPSSASSVRPLARPILARIVGSLGPFAPDSLVVPVATWVARRLRAVGQFAGAT
ncbi:hypothetical protein BN11_830014 [Nostocoides australiense Ben110]|uniref:Uncharacterized protein n=1 Tax=Nostocoides australiense Ben110 TaxID=1193182 RepID=W6K2Y2_9MICO|nr:hypothetical protein BN11_830014 [Tetrasphaera australiensis Ben110]